MDPFNTAAGDDDDADGDGKDGDKGDDASQSSKKYRPDETAGGAKDTRAPALPAARGILL